MHEILERNKQLYDGTIINTFRTLAVSCNMLEVEAGTTGPKGGDSSSGCRTYLRIQDVGGTDIKVNKIKGGVELTLGGDTELDTLIHALKFANKVLKYQRKNNVC